jgi:hypothetical protein
MTIPTPTLSPGISTYLTVSAVMLSLGGFTIAVDLYRRFMAVRPTPMLTLYAATLGMVALVWLVLGYGRLLAPGYWTPVWVGVGAVAGLAATRLDRSIVRAFEARRRRARGTRAAPLQLARGAPSTMLTVNANEFPLGSILAIAVLEELLYRAFLTEFALAQAGLLLQGAILATVTLCFALSHIWFGWPHVLSKAPLGLFALGLTLASGNVWGAVVAHLVFNGLAWRDMTRELTLRPQEYGR